MPITPYKLRPRTPVVALLLPNGKAVDEFGSNINLDKLNEQLPENPPVRVWTNHEISHSLVRKGFGEALCWNNEEIRWRHRHFEDGWKNRPSDVFVLKTPFPMKGDELDVRRTDRKSVV